MNLKIVGLQTHEDESPLAFTVMFDHLDRGGRMVATVSEAAFFDSAAHPDCEGIDVEPMACGTVHSEQSTQKLWFGSSKNLSGTK